MAATLAIVGASLRTMDPDRPHATAIACDGETIVAVGDDADIREVCDARTEIVAGSGWHLTPGLTDGHQHLLYGAELGRGVDFDRVPDLPAVRNRLAAAAREVEPGQWVRGFALEYESLGGRPFHHAMFDDVAAGRPTFVFTLDLHTAFVNEAALRIAGITGPREFSDGSQIVVDDDGVPTGELRERSALDLVLDVMPEPTREEAIQSYVEAIARQNALGITAIHQMDGDPATVQTFADLEAAGVLSMHVAIHNVITPTTDADYVDELVRAAPRRGDRWRADGIKFWLDGVVETGTAWLEHPDDRGGGTEPYWPSPTEWAAVVRRCHDAGLRVATHAIGDQAVRVALDTYRDLPGGASRHRIEHIETAPDATITRFRAEGVTASMQPIHLRWLKPDLSDPWSQRLTHEQCAHAMRSGDLTADGALVVLGSDWPVAPYDPRLGMFAAQLRSAPDTDDDTPIGASQPLTGPQTLAGYTVNAARAIGEQDVAGMLRAGYRADVVAWGADVTQCAPRDVVDVPVHLTVQSGRVVHRGDA